MARIAINGLGRIGKLVLRAFVEEGIPGEIVLLNDAVGDPGQHAHLFEFGTPPVLRRPVHDGLRVGH
ncbi:MAG: glyceraldehyde 3-phosphate dehydrogenase NAD-binding domain-containing protein, partial [Pseudomonadota bacterium]